MITNEEIAKEAGVSTATVSRVLNHLPGVAQATKEAVLAACERLGRPISREVVRRKVLVISVPSGVSFIEPLVQAATVYPMSLLFRNVHPGDLTVENIAEDITLDGPFDGAVLVDCEVEKEVMAELQKHMPVVECRNYNSFEPEASVLVDDFQLGKKLTEHLLENGKKRIAYVIFSEKMQNRPHGIERLDGFHAALMRAGCTPAAFYHLEEEDSWERMMADAGTVFDAIIFPEPFNSILPFARALQDRGFRIPEDLQIAACGDSQTMELGGITVMRQPLFAIAGGALFLLDSMMNGRLNLQESMQIRYQPELIVRDSTRKNGDDIQPAP